MTAQSQHGTESQQGTGDPREAAIAALATRAYETAGDEYTRAGWRLLADPRGELDPFDGAEKGWVGVGLSHLAVAGICYRVSGQPARANHRATEGLAVSRDLRECVDQPVKRACLMEMGADFRAIGTSDPTEVQDAYDRAEAAYRAAGDSIENPQTWATTPLFEAAATPLKQTARTLANGEIAVDWETLHGADPSRAGAFLAARTTYKRQRFPSLLEGVVNEGKLGAPRGTTAYSTDHHRCPECGSTDVNWIAGKTLCLRCSSPSEPQ